MKLSRGVQWARLIINTPDSPNAREGDGKSPSVTKIGDKRNLRRISRLKFFVEGKVNIKKGMGHQKKKDREEKVCRSNSEQSSKSTPIREA